MSETQRVPAVGEASSPAGTYQVDGENSTVRFRAKAFGLMWVRGSLPVIGGSVEIADGQWRGNLLLGADGIGTGLGPRDLHLRSSHYLGADKHPVISVSVDNFDPSEDIAIGEVVVRDKAVTVQFEVKTAGVVDGSLLRVTASTELDRTVFPMLGPWAGVSRRVNLEATIHARPVAG